MMFIPLKHFMKLRRLPSAWSQILEQVAFRKFRESADDIDPGEPFLLAYKKRQELKEKGDPWLFELFLTEREFQGGKVKPYLEYQSLKDHNERVNLKNMEKQA